MLSIVILNALMLSVVLSLNAKTMEHSILDTNAGKQLI